jgi:hypothetical protein
MLLLDSLRNCNNVLPLSVAFDASQCCICLQDGLVAGAGSSLGGGGHEGSQTVTCASFNITSIPLGVILFGYAGLCGQNAVRNLRTNSLKSSQ